MDNSQTIKEALGFSELSEQEKKSRGILGRLFGPVASFLAPTRNGRKYTDELWEKVLKNDLVQEMFKSGGLPGEIQHPVDREETDPEKIAIMMPESPKKDKDGHLIGYFDILDTPCGRIAYQLCKYGFKFGVSSRGSGDTYIDNDGQESVDPDSYTLNAWDLVLIPACKDARMTFTESLNKPTLKRALTEALENSTEDEKRVMKEALDDLKIDLSGSGKQDKAADNDGAMLMEEYKKVLKENTALKEKVGTLQEKLSVSYTKEADSVDKLNNLKTTVVNLTEQVRKLKSLQTELDQLKESLATKDRQLNIQAKVISESKTAKTVLDKRVRRLSESVDTAKKESEVLQEKLNKASNSMREAETIAEQEKNALRESIEELKKDSEIKRSEYIAKLSKANSLVERYKKIASTAATRYIESKATQIGVSKEEIRNRLPEGYTFDDVDQVCEDLKDYKLNISRLPFDLSKSSVRVRVRESVETPKQKNGLVGDDDVDDELLHLAKLK